MKSKLWVFRDVNLISAGFISPGPLDFSCHRLVVSGSWRDHAG